MTALLRTAASNVAHGLLRGLLVGLALIGLGLLRAVLVIVAGHSVVGPTVSDARPLAFYVAGFSLAGGVAGAFRLFVHHAFWRYVVFSVAGLIAVATIVAGGDAQMQWDGLTFMLLTPIGIILGLFGIYIIEHHFGGAGLWRVRPSKQRPDGR
jgi:hypothetical protein